MLTIEPGTEQHVELDLLESTIPSLTTSPSCKPILEQDFKKVFESISTSTVKSRISEIHNEDVGSSSAGQQQIEENQKQQPITTGSSHLEPFGEDDLEDEDQNVGNEVKPIPKHRGLQKINSTDLLHRQIKDTMTEQVMCEDDDSVMSESAIKTTSATVEDNSEESMVMIMEQANVLSESSDIVKNANETFVEEPEWEMVESEMAEVPDLPDITKDEEEKVPIVVIQPPQVNMSPEHALVIATEVVRQVQVQAIAKCEEIASANQEQNQALPKPTPDSKFTPETKEKVQVYLKSLEESEEYDQVAADLITNIVSKKEEKIKKLKESCVDISDDQSRSEAMLSELKNELGRSSVTDEDLVTDMNSDFLEEINIQEMKNRLEATMNKPFQPEAVAEDFRFQSSFREHYVKDVTEDVKDTIDDKQSQKKNVDVTDSDNKESSKGDDGKQSKPDIIVQEDIWAEESKHVNKDAHIKEKKSDNESMSSDSKQSHRKSGTDYEGYTSGDTLVSGGNLSHHSNSSRPVSSDVDAMYSAVSEYSSTTENTEFVTAHDKSSGDTSFFTAASSLSSRNSVISSESSGHLGSVEVSECSETLVESSLEYDGHEGNDTPNSMKHLDEILDKNPFEFDSPESAGVSPSTSKLDTKVSSVEMVTSLYSEVKHSSESQQESMSESVSHARQHLGADFSESRETLSSSMLTLSSISEATVVGPDPLLAGSSQMLTSQTIHRSFVLPKDTETGLIGTHMSVEIGNEQQLALENEDDQNQVFQLPRMRCIEGAHAVQITIPQEISIDLGSEYDSRPSSELAESRPLSADKVSRPVTPEITKSKFSRRAFSIDETVSDSLRVEEPFARPVSPMPQKHRIGSTDSDDGKLKISLASQGRSVSPVPPKLLETDESLEADIAFSKHFTQVLEDDEESSEIIKTSEGQTGPVSNKLHDITPDSQNTSESMETSGQDFFLDQQYSKDSTKARSPRLQHDLDDDLLVGSPPMVSRPLGVKYWPPVDNLDQEQDGSVPLDKRSITRSESDDNSESRQEIDTAEVDKEVETSKKWLESQFEEVPDEFGNFTYSQPLDKIVEEEEEHYSITSEEMKELAKFKESLSSTPDFEAIALRRHQIFKSGDDELSLGSLTEFERLEREADLGSGSGSRGSLGSSDSLELLHASNNGAKPTHLAVKVISKSGQGDDVSVSSETSLKSFEMMERACDEAEIIERTAKQQEEVLSEIEEGHESQVSESETNETLSECENQSDEEYEDRIFEIDSIIKQAQVNVEKFDQEGFSVAKPGELSLENLIYRPESKTESVSTQDSLEENNVIDLPLDTQTKAGFRLVRPGDELMQASVDSLDSKITSSLNVMTTSADSLEPDTPRSTTDKMTMSTDSIENNRGTAVCGDPMMVSVDSLDGKQMVDAVARDGQEGSSGTGPSSLLFTSTDSLESGSNMTRATASMLSSITSQDSETFVADDEFETEDEEIRRTRKFLMSQGNIRFEDSDESTTCSHSSPQLQLKAGGSSSDLLYQLPLQQQLTSHFSDPFIMTTTTTTTTEEVLQTQVIDDKGNVVSELNKQTIVESSTGETKDETTMKEITEQIDEHGNKKVVIIQKSIEKET